MPRRPLFTIRFKTAFGDKPQNTWDGKTVVWAKHRLQDSYYRQVLNRIRRMK